MSYEITNWQNGDIITAEKLNNLEQSAAEKGIKIIPVTWHYSDYDSSIDGGVLGITWNEVKNYIESGVFCFTSRMNQYIPNMKLQTEKIGI